MAGVSSARIKPAFGGMNSEASPEYVPDNQAAVLENLLPRPGKVVLRGPISTGIDLGLTQYSRIIGAMVIDSSILVYYDENGVQNFKEIQLGVVGAGAGTGFGGRSCTLASLSYAVRPALSIAFLVRWAGAGACALLAGSTTASDITVHLSRLFTIRRDTSQLCWSDQGGAPAGIASEWQDDVSGLLNQIIVGDSNDRSRALGHVGKQLAILKDRSIWMLTGLTPATFSVNRVTSEWGCVSAESVVDHDEGCFFLSERGFAYFDGSNVVDVSADIQAELLTAMRDAPFPYDVNDVVNRYAPGIAVPFARAARIGRGCIMLTVGREGNVAATAPTVLFCGIYDIQQRTWTRFTSDAFPTSAPVFFIPTPAGSYYAGATLGYTASGDLVYLDDLATPEGSTATVSGEDTVSGTTAVVPAASYSRIIQLSSPGKRSQLKRLLLDYTFVVVADGETSVDCWSVSLVDGQGNTLLAATPVQATILASGYTDTQRRAALVRKRFQVEFFGEASEVQLRVTLPTLDTGVTEVIAAEIHDATIEFIPGRDRPTS